MSISIEKLQHSECSELVLHRFMEKEEYLLPDPLSKHVNLSDYAHKLMEFGSTYIALTEDAICGLISGYINDYKTKEAYIQLLLVAEDAQGKGLGSKLIQSFLEEAIYLFGEGRAFLTVDKCNTKAYELYKHIGFVESARIHPNKEKLIMVKIF